MDNFYNGKIVIEFYSPGCHSCVTMTPIITELLKDYSQIKLLKVNADTATNLVEQFQVTILPTLVFLNNGQIRQKISGLRVKNAIKKCLDEL